MVAEQKRLVLVWFPTVAEAEQLAVFDKLVYEQNSLTVSQWRKLLTRSSAVTLALAVKHKEELTAYAVVETHKDYNELLRLGVHPFHRRQQYGSIIVKLFGDEDQLQLRLRERNEQALKFAKSNGFKAVQLEKGGWLDGDGIVLVREKNFSGNS